MTSPSNVFAKVWLAAIRKRQTGRRHHINIPTSHQSPTQTIGDFKGSSWLHCNSSSRLVSIFPHLVAQEVLLVPRGARWLTVRGPFELPSQLRPSVPLLCVPARKAAWMLAWTH
ncbi:hypothetical protein PAMA_000128 [Pampus argenteus]